jgi:hypothetical protein
VLLSHASSSSVEPLLFGDFEIFIGIILDLLVLAKSDIIMILSHLEHQHGVSPFFFFLF